MKCRGSTLVVVLIVLALLGAGGGVAAHQAGNGAKWYAPTTWFSHSDADKVDAAKKADDQAELAKRAAESAAVHAASVESDKANRAAAALPDSNESTVVKRFTGNTFGLLNQVSPLTASEQDNNTSILIGLLSSEIAKRQVSEALQAKSDAERVKASAGLENAVKELGLTKKALAEADAKLRESFDTENGLANELRATTARHYIVIGIAAILLAAFLYLRVVASQYGATLHLATQILPQDKAKALVADADSALGAVGQWLVRTGRLAAAKAHQEAQSIVADHDPS